MEYGLWQITGCVIVVILAYRLPEIIRAFKNK